MIVSTCIISIPVVCLKHKQSHLKSPQTRYKLWFISDLTEIWSCKKQKNAGIAHMHTQIHAHCFFPFFFSVCVFVFTAGVPFRSSFRQRYIYWKASLNLNQEIQLKIYFYRPNNRHFCKYFQRSLYYVKASDIKYQASQCYSIMLPNASIGPRPVKKKNVNLFDYGTLKSIHLHANAQTWIPHSHFQ